MGRSPGVDARRHRTNPGLSSVAPLGQVSFRLRQTSARQFVDHFVDTDEMVKGLDADHFAAIRIMVGS